jgi:small subunit ribosomal protein S20
LAEKKKSLSVLKRQRQNEKRRLRNASTKSKVKTLMKKVQQAIENKDIKTAQEAFKEFSSCIDKAARKNIIHPNNAARKKSKLALKINALSA